VEARAGRRGAQRRLVARVNVVVGNRLVAGIWIRIAAVADTIGIDVVLVRVVKGGAVVDGIVDPVVIGVGERSRRTVYVRRRARERQCGGPDEEKQSKSEDETPLALRHHGL
jgi:hypothetical protein